MKWNLFWGFLNLLFGIVDIFLLSDGLDARILGTASLFMAGVLLSSALDEYLESRENLE